MNKYINLVEPKKIIKTIKDYQTSYKVKQDLKGKINVHGKRFEREIKKQKLVHGLHKPSLDIDKKFATYYEKPTSTPVLAAFKNGAVISQYNQYKTFINSAPFEGYVKANFLSNAYGESIHNAEKNIKEETNKLVNITNAQKTVKAHRNFFQKHIKAFRSEYDKNLSEAKKLASGKIKDETKYISTLRYNQNRLNQKIIKFEKNHKADFDNMEKLAANLTKQQDLRNQAKKEHNIASKKDVQTIPAYKPATS
jgi:hypothetical protein